MQKRLTKTVVEDEQAATARVLIWDSGDGAIKGFGLKVEPSGKKSFVYQYRMAGGRGAPTKRYTIGEFSTGLTVAKARGIAEALEVKVRSGIDPIEDDKAKAAKDLIDCGYTPEEAQRRVGLQKQAVPGVKETTGASAPIFAYHIQGGIVTPNEVRNTLGLEPKPGGDTLPIVAGQPPQPPPLAMELSTEPREEETPEPHYSETIADALNERGEAVCPCDRHEPRSCPRCGVTRRPMMKDDVWVDTWQPRRRAS